MQHVYCIGIVDVVLMLGLCGLHDLVWIVWLGKRNFEDSPKSIFDFSCYVTVLCAM
jgi:hypothetical protein